MAATECGSKKRFKGIENFLRKVAYNLGNSPSQTEVKIISCIPIDVTDLQQKICCLERELEKVTCGKMPMPVQAVHTALTAPANHAPPEPRAPPDYTHLACPDICPHKTSAVSIMIPSQKPMTPQIKKEPHSSGTLIESESRKKNLFKRHRKPRKNSPLVYYAHTTTSPFNNYRKEITSRREMKRMNAANVNPPYVRDLLKQYRPEMYGEQWTGTSSQASQPICRDDAAPPPAARADADACSCCRGLFYDLDREYRPYLLLDDSLPANMHRNIDSGNIYYNSSYYDIYPVKEKPNRDKKETDTFKRWEKLQLGNSCIRENFKTNVECRTVLKNTAPALLCINKTGKFAKRREHVPKRLSNVNESSGNTVVECSDFCVKPAIPKKRKREKLPNKTILMKNAECLTHNVNNSECQTESSDNMQTEGSNQPEENQTEATLNQIKSILQSVLSHVKTSNQIKEQSDSKEKKDAVVQQELQANSQEGSRLLHSFTYSPFAMDPCTVSNSSAAPAACPPAACPPVVISPPSMSMPSSHFKCMQNFPVFIQHTPTQHAYRGCNHPRPHVNRHQISTNTSFPTDEKRSKETENLIKEIYKSIALNIPLKQASNSDFIDTSARNVSRIEPGDAVISNMMTMSRQVGVCRGDKAWGRVPVSTATTSRATSNTRSSLGRADDQRSVGSKARPRRAPPRPAGRRSDAASASERPRRRPSVVPESTSQSEDTESASSASDSDDTVVPDNDKQSTKSTVKKSIFRKMFGSVFKRRRKVKNDDRARSVTESESDSDDYQTVYSQKVERPKRVTYAPARRPRARGSALRLPQNRRHSPFMEPEHRRYWHEQLMFQRRHAKYTSEQAPTPPRSVRSRRPGIHFRKYEARPALIETACPFQPERDFEPPTPLPRPRKVVGGKMSNRKLTWLKKHSPKIQCGPQWKKLLIEG